MSWRLQTFGSDGSYIFATGNSIEKTNYGKETVSKIDSSGSVRLNETTVNGKVDVGGSVIANRCEILGSVFAENHVILRQSAVQGDVLAGRDVTVENSKIDGILQCFSNHLIIERAQIDTIDLRCAGIFMWSDGFSSGNDVLLNQLQSESSSSVESNGQRQVLELRNCTVRNIIFEGGKGEVVLAGDSSISGNIAGGKVRS